MTKDERRLTEKWLKADGEKEMHIRVVAARAREFLPYVEADLALMKKLLSKYDQES